MDFSLSADQIAFRDTLRDVLASSRDELVWNGLAAMGLFGLLVDESAGGLGLTEVDAVLLLEQLGYFAVAEPVAETIVAATLDPGLATGAERVALAAEVVHYGRDADRLLVVTPSRVRLADPKDVVDATTVDTTLRAAHASPGPCTQAPGDPALTRDRLWLATAAQLIGLGRRMLDLTTQHVRTRRQFGVPVGSFQAVKHHLANALLELEFAAPAVLAAGWALSRRTPDAPRAVSMAAVLAAEAATGVARTAIQCHGAIGYTVEYELHRFAKRAWALAATVDIDEHLERVARSLCLPGKE